MDVSLELLCVSERSEELRLFLEPLERAGYRLEVRWVEGAEDLRGALAGRDFDLALCGPHLPGWDPCSVLALLRGVAPVLPVVAVAPRVDGEARGALLRAGAFAVVREPEELPSVVARGLALARKLRPKGTGRSAPASRPGEKGGLEPGAQILLVDDQDAVLRVARRLLQRSGYQVTGFRSAERALDHFRVRPESFDVVITDYSLEKRSGLVLAGELRKLRPALPILLMTGYGDSLDFETPEGSSVSGVIQKPFRGHELLDAVRRALAAGAPARSESRARDSLAGPAPRR